MYWPQVFIIVLLAGAVAYSTAKHGETPAPYNCFVTLVSAIVWAVVLGYGGFWS